MSSNVSVDKAGTITPRAGSRSAVRESERLRGAAAGLPPDPGNAQPNPGVSVSVRQGRNAGVGQWRRHRVLPSPLIVVLAVVLLILIVPPSVFLIEVSLHRALPDGGMGAFTFDNYRHLFTSRFFLTSLTNTTIYGVGSAVVAICLGTVLALIVERTDTPGRSWVILGAIISLGIPHVLYVVGWLLALGREGPVNKLLMGLTGGDAPPLHVYSLWGMILIEGVGFVPLTYLLMSAVMRSMDASFEEASMMSGARPVRTFWTITLRMGLPGVLALLLLVFIRSFESFETPALVGLGGNINVLATDIYQRTHSTGMPNYGESGAYSVCLLLIVAVLLIWYSRLSRNAHRFQTITGKGFRPRVIQLGRTRYASCALLVLLFVFVAVLPIAMLVFTSLQPFYAGVTLASLGRFTIANYVTTLGPGSFRDSIYNTLIMGAATASIAVPFTALCAWVAARRPGGWVLDQLATMPLVFPSIVMGVAFLYVFVALPLPLYGTLTSIIIASIVQYTPYGMRYAFAGVLQIHSDLEDASMISGGRDMSTFRRVVLPLIAPALVGGWLFIFLLSVRVVSLPLLLSGPGSEVVSVTLFELWQNGQVTALAAMGVSWVVLMTAVSAAFFYVMRRYQLSVS